MQLKHACPTCAHMQSNSRSSRLRFDTEQMSRNVEAQACKTGGRLQGLAPLSLDASNPTGKAKKQKLHERLKRGRTQAGLRGSRESRGAVHEFSCKNPHIAQALRTLVDLALSQTIGLSTNGKRDCWASLKEVIRTAGCRFIIGLTFSIPSRPLCQHLQMSRE